MEYLRPLTGSYSERQAHWLKLHGLKVGSKVKVVRKVEDGCRWNTDGEMDKTIGTIGVISQIAGIYEEGILVKFEDRSWVYHYQCLEPVK